MSSKESNSLEIKGCRTASETISAIELWSMGSTVASWRSVKGTFQGVERIWLISSLQPGYVDSFLMLHLKSPYTQKSMLGDLLWALGPISYLRKIPHRKLHYSRFPTNGITLPHLFLPKHLQGVCAITIVIASAILSHSTHHALCKTSLPLQVTIKVEIP